MWNVFGGEPGGYYNWRYLTLWTTMKLDKVMFYIRELNATDYLTEDILLDMKIRSIQVTYDGASFSEAFSVHSEYTNLGINASQVINTDDLSDAWMTPWLSVS
ncbi:hypothetical protein [Heterosigma akashiwo virus 01]|uniref:Uncharacterized protein n=1 Tax=Heterosigma akashiwo virus 01 TaxID=97195 RepID=A0A1C9C5H7_HAV01|nr:hypothetical protein D1R72_gp206 [Heterosigma akashiwo virus 01]AOM63537.1 hypothetical protein [Heterosigma akashiwo virus 01]